jgi:pyrroline-5-carboxylate reductase
MFIIEKWEEVAISKGFTPEQAAKLVRSTLIGSAELLATTGDEPALIRKNVTSPGGTTERIIATLDAGKLNELFDSALEAAVKRAHEIASSNS